jgi:thioredoxin-related protein
MIEAIKVLDFEGNSLNLINKYWGKALLLIVYNNQCLGCTGRAIPLAYAFQQTYSALHVVGIHSNFGKESTSKADIQSIFTSGEIPFPIYLDEEHSVFDQFESQGTPQWILISEKGKLLHSIFGSQEGAQNRLMYALEEWSTSRK